MRVPVGISGETKPSIKPATKSSGKTGASSAQARVDSVFSAKQRVRAPGATSESDQDKMNALGYVEHEQDDANATEGVE